VSHITVGSNPYALGAGLGPPFSHKRNRECARTGLTSTLHFLKSNNLSRIEPMPFLADRSLNSEQQERVCFDVHYGTGIALPGQGSGP
jgi:hypothetical protein